MVDLVKLRRKAKKAAEAQKQQNGEVQVADPGAVAVPGRDESDPSLGARPTSLRAGSPPRRRGEKGLDAKPRLETTSAAEAVTPAAALAAPPTTPVVTPPVASQAAPSAPPAPVSSKLDRFKEEAGRRRDIVRESAAPAEDSASRLELLAFVLGHESYAIEIEHIVEIVTPRAATRIPNADPSIVGIISLRGTIVALLDVRRRLNQRALAASEDTRIIVLEYDGQSLGFEVDRVQRVVKLDAAGVEPHPVVHASESDECIRGVFRQDGALTILLDLDKLLGGDGRRSGQAATKERLAPPA